MMLYLAFALGFFTAWLLLAWGCAVAHSASFSRREERPPHAFL